MPKSKLPITEDLDFAYLLELMRPLHDEPAYCWLPELFSIIGHESLLKLCKYAGGETIKIPTLDELSNSLESLQWFYDVYIKHCKELFEVPKQFKDSVDRIAEVYYVGDNTK